MRRYSLFLVLIFSLIQITNLSAQINYPGGRIALTFDGNLHDQDDWGASAFSLALIDAADLNDRVVHIDINNHLSQTNNNWESQMRTSIYGAAERYSFNRNLIYDHKANSDAAVNHLASEINQSSSSKALWIIAAGPMETVWRSLNQADSEKLKFVKVVTHSWWNNEHDVSNHGGNGQLIHNWLDLVDDFQGKGVSFIRIEDQNHSNGQYDFNTPRQNWEWLKNSDNADYRWLYSRDSFSNKFDVSDAGMVYWLLTGGTSGGCQNCGWREVKELFKVSVDKDQPEENNNNNQSEKFSIPGTVQAEDYVSGQGVSSGNRSGGYLSNIEGGDYAEYSVSVEESGMYQLTYKVASNTMGGDIDLLINGDNKATVDVSNTGGSYSWQEFATELYLSEGTNQIRLRFRGSADDMFKIDEFSFDLEEKSTDNQDEEDDSEQIKADFIIPGIVQAEEYASAQGIGTGNLSGGYIGDIDGGDYAEYNVSVEENGTYQLTYKVASNTQGGDIDLLINGDNKATVDIYNTGGSYKWQEFTTELYLSKGTNQIRLRFRGSADDMFKIDEFSFDLEEKSTDNQDEEDDSEQIKADFIIPGIVQAEEYASAQGIGTGNLSGGYIGDIDGGDYAEYNVSVEESGTYLLTYKVASNTQGGDIDLFVSGDYKVTVDVFNTGGTYNWQSYSTELKLEQGNTTIRLRFRGSADDMFKIDEFSFEKNNNNARTTFSSNSKKESKSEATSAFREQAAQNVVLNLFPNPATEKVYANINDGDYTIYAIDGSQIKSGVIKENGEIDISGIKKGTYIVKIGFDANVKISKIIVD